MGLCASSNDSNLSPEEKAKLKKEKANARDLDRELNRDNEQDSAINKLLLLGAGESGKSTLFKQMITIYGTGFPESERKTFEPIIYNNIITSMQALLEAVPQFGGGLMQENELSQVVLDMEGNEEIDQKTADQIKALWQDPGVQRAYENRSKFQLTDSAEYFFNKIDEVADVNYLPSEQDVLRSRVRTTGIVENSFTIDGNNFKMFDVGGQRNERKKWIHCFENVTAVLFVGVLSEYDLVLYEDETMNRMIETLTLFDEILNSRWFKETSVILFLNKCDLFEEKIQKVSIKVCPVFADWEGDDKNYDECCGAIENEFHKKNRNPEKQVYCHVTCATDTSNIQAVFDAVKDIIIRKSLGEAGLV